MSRDLYLLRFMYDKYKYGFITFTDLSKDIGWGRMDLLRAVHSLESWGFFGDQRYGRVRGNPNSVGTGYCLDGKYATDYFVSQLSKLEDMSV